MKRSFFILFILFFFNSFTLEASDSNSKDFTRFSVSPLYRLPDKDITVEWSTPSPQGIEILYGDTVITGGSEGKYTIPASGLTTMPESFELRVRVNSENGEEKKVKIETFAEPREIEKNAEQVGFTDRYVISFPDSLWDSDLVIQKVELDFPKNYYCGNLDFDVRFLEIETKWEYYNQNRDVSGYLNWSNQYISKRGFPVVAGGSSWTFRFWNYPWHERCRDIRPDRFDPDIIFTIGAEEK